MLKPGHKLYISIISRQQERKGDRKNRQNSSYALRIFNYHRVKSGNGRFAIDAIDSNDFEKQIQILKKYFNIVPLEFAIRALPRGELRPNSVCLTFDDGYMDNYEYAYPILKRYNAPATIFLTTDFIGTGKYLWHDRILWALEKAEVTELSFVRLGIENVVIADENVRKKFAISVLEKLKTFTPEERDEMIQELYQILNINSFPQDILMLDWHQIKEMKSAGIAFGSHTKTHPILSMLKNEDLEEEVAGSKKIIESHLDTSIETFAYPNGRRGDFDERTKNILVQNGYKCAVTTCHGLNNQFHDLFELFRISPWETDPHRFYGRLVLEQLCN